MIDEEMKREEKKPKLPQSKDRKRSNGVKKSSKKDEFSSIEKSDSNSSDVKKLNRIHQAYERNIERVERVNPGFKLEKIPLKGNFRFLSQQLAAYKGSLGEDTLLTPFGKATIQFNKGKGEDTIDKRVIRPDPTKYEEIAQAIDNVLKNDKLNIYTERNLKLWHKKKKLISQLVTQNVIFILIVNLLDFRKKQILFQLVL